VTGLDFAGPLYTKKDQSAKSYILLLTCATTRALHLELSSDMSVDKFLMALDGFVSRRGLPHTIYSNNATTFQAARRELAEICAIFHDPRTSHYFAHRGITWKFIAPGLDGEDGGSEW
jgi:transposase InsO family protein